MGLTVFGTVLSQIQPPKAHAAPQTYDSIKSIQVQAQLTTEFWAAYYCSPFLPDNPGQPDLAVGNWFASQDPTGGLGGIFGIPTNKLSKTVIVGHHVDDTDGKVDCGAEVGSQTKIDWFSNLLDEAGYSGDFITPARVVWGNGSQPNPQQVRINNLMKVLDKNLFSGSMPPKVAPDKVVYAALLTDFTSQNACKAAKAPTDANSVAQLQYKKTIWVVDPTTGKATQMLYGYQNGGDSISIGYGLGSDDGTMTCDQIANILANQKYANAVQQALADGSTTDIPGLSGTAGDTAGGDANPELDCGTPWVSLTWYLCPVVHLINSILYGLDNAITSLLSVDQSKIFDTSTVTGAGYYKAWQAFRSIALGILVIAALIMIIGQALGFEVLDAYTIKKVLPRLIIAIIGISLSWDIMNWFVGFTNDLGFGIRNIIYFPFHSVNGFDANLNNGAVLLLGLLTGGAIIALGLLGLLSFGVTALLGLIVGFIVLVLRQLIIVALILAAPVAIVCYVLPNTQNIWKIWHESFTKALLMFPLIISFIAIGRVMAILSSGPDSTAVSQIIGLISYIIPYFLIPLTLRFAGGILRTVGGFVNDRSSGVFDGLKKYRSNTRKERIKKAQNNQLYDPSSRLGRMVNPLASWATDPLSNAAATGKVPFLRKRGAKVLSHIEHARLEQSKKLMQEMNDGGANDKAYRILAGVHDRGLDPETQKKLRASKSNLYGRAPQTLAEMQEIAHILSESDSATERGAATFIEGHAGRLATLYQDPEMGKASIQAAGIMGLAAHGFANGEDLAEAGNMLQTKGGEGFATGVLTQAQLMGARSRPDIKAGYGWVYKNGKYVSGISAEGGRAPSLVQTLATQDWSGAKGGAIDDLSSQIHDYLITPDNNQRRAMKDQLFSIGGRYSSASQDVKMKVLDIIQQHGLEREFKNFERGIDGGVLTRGQGGPPQGGGGTGQPGGGQNPQNPTNPVP